MIAEAESREELLAEEATATVTVTVTVRMTVTVNWPATPTSWAK